MGNVTLTSVLNASIGGYSLGNILAAGVTFVVCLTVIRVIMRILNRILSKTNLEKRVQRLIANFLKYAMYVVTVVIVAQGLGVNMSSFVALLSVVSLGITLAAEDILANFAGGLVIFSTHPFSIGDFIESSGTTGTVEEIDLHHTKLLTPDGYFVYVPNKDLSGTRVVNYTALGRRRVTVKVTASYDAPTETVMSALRTAVSRTPDILAEPEPGYWLTNYGASSIEYTVFCWTKSANYWTVLCGLNAALRPAFEEAGVEMTYDHLNVHLVGDAPAADVKMSLKKSDDES